MNRSQRRKDPDAVTDAGHGAESRHHLLNNDEHGNEQWQGPEQRVAEVLARLGVSGDPAGVVITHHDDETRTNDGEQRQKASAIATSTFVVVRADGAKCSGNLCLIRFLALHVPSPFVSCGRWAKQPRGNERG